MRKEATNAYSGSNLLVHSVLRAVVQGKRHSGLWWKALQSADNGLECGLGGFPIQPGKKKKSASAFHQGIEGHKAFSGH